MAAKAATAALAAERCELCGHGWERGSMKERMAHFRGRHPAYARGLMLRLAAPGAFLVALGVLAASRAPQWAYLVAMVATYGLLFMGRVRSRLERKRAGTSPALPLRRLVKEGGLGFLLIAPVVALLMLLASTRS